MLSLKVVWRHLIKFKANFRRQVCDARITICIYNYRVHSMHTTRRDAIQAT